jgi:hypothetical protein
LQGELKSKSIIQPHSTAPHVRALAATWEKPSAIRELELKGIAEHKTFMTKGHPYA